MTDINKTLCESLLMAEHEDEVMRILQEAGYDDLHDDDCWRPLGDSTGNFTTVNNQSADAMTPVVEKLINAIDHVLISECHRRGIDPESSEAPGNMKEAAERFFNVPQGMLDELTHSEARKLGNNINLIATGAKKSPCLLITDHGEGQSPDDFPKTFLSLGQQSQKATIPFTQGKNNAGGTGSLMFCGKRNMQLIVSKRAPHAVGYGEHSDDDKIGFTLIARRRPKPGSGNSVFVYLAPGGRVPRYKADGIPALTAQSEPGRKLTPYARSMEHGTCVKLYNYQWKPRTNIALDAARQLERAFQDPCLPIRIQETREGYRARTPEITFRGAWPNLRKKSRETEGSLDLGPATIQLNLKKAGPITVTFAVWPEDTNLAHVPRGADLLRNGRSQYRLPPSFRNKLKHSYISEYMFVAVDCSEMRDDEDFFLADRSKVRQGPLKDELIGKVVEALNEHEGLKASNEKRYQDRTRKVNDEITTDLFNELIDREPAVAEMFGLGRKLMQPRGRGEDKAFKGRKIPTYFDLRKTPEGRLVKKLAVNRTAKIECLTDADNDYFVRSLDTGRLTIEPSEVEIERQKLWNGVWVGSVRLPKGTQPGTDTVCRIHVTDPVNEISGGFGVEFTLHALEEDTRKGKPGGKPNPDENRKGKNRTKSEKRVDQPEVFEVRQEDWDKHGFKSARQTIIIHHKPDGQGYTYYINMDNEFLLTELRERPDETDTLKNNFKTALTLLAVSLIRGQKDGRLNAPNDDDQSAHQDLDEIGRICDVAALVQLPLSRLGAPAKQRRSNAA
jgi:hypothetical protein